MVVKTEKSKKTIDTEQLKPLGEGKDGTVFEYDNQALKLNISGYMTEEKIRDLRDSVPNSEEIRIVPPIEILTDPLKTTPRVKLNIAAGYTSRLIRENPSFILMKSKEEYLEELFLIRKQVNEHMSTNQIGLSDSNPSNVLVSSDNGQLYIIDHDRDITPSCMQYEKGMIRGGNYYEHNDRKLSLLMYKCLLLQLLKFNGIKFTSGGDPVIRFVESETERKDITFKTIEDTLSDYRSISDYTKDTVRKIKRR